MLKSIALCLSLTLALPAWAQDAQRIPADIGARVVERYVAPRLAAFSAASVKLRDRMEVLCTEPAAANLDAARESFADTVQAWGSVSVLRFGPLAWENRFERIFFWPDTRGVILRQVRAVLAERSEEAVTREGLANKSVAVQGLPALEFVLFGSGADALAEAGSGHRCRYAMAIAANLVALAGAIETAWSPGEPFYAEFIEPAPSNTLYRTSGEVASEVVKALGTALQFTRNAELLPALGESVAKANGRRAPFWRSNLTFALVAAQIEGVIGLLQASGFDTELDEGGRSVMDSVLFELEHALRAIEAVQGPAETAFAEEKERGRISYVTLALEGANHSIGEHLSAAIGLTMGFNALDGD